jgi:hypothetical protein
MQLAVKGFRHFDILGDNRFATNGIRLRAHPQMRDTRLLVSALYIADNLAGLTLSIPRTNGGW